MVETTTMTIPSKVARFGFEASCSIRHMENTVGLRRATCLATQTFDDIINLLILLF